MREKQQFREIKEECALPEEKTGITGRFPADSAALRERLGCDRSFDLIERPLRVAGRAAALYFVDGLCKDEVMEKVTEYLIKLKPDDIAGLNSEEFLSRHMPYIESEVSSVLPDVSDAVLSGQLAFLLDGLSAAVLIDARTYPARGPEEPEGDKVLRGSRDGFVETVVHNTAMLRRRLRTGKLVMEHHAVCDRSKTDVVICYLRDVADEKLLKRIRERVDRVDLHALTMSQETMSQCLLDRQWWNPFPRMRCTERPDVAAAELAEGRILVIVDNSPVVMVLPGLLFDFTQEANDFYFPPVVGTFLRLIRMFALLLTTFLVPVWYLLTLYEGMLPEWLRFLMVKEPNGISLIWQILLAELVLDVVRMASMNTPSALSNAFSVVGALILGDFGVQVGWLVPEVVLYMGFTAVTGFAQVSYELGYAIKLSRLLILVLTALFGFWGFIGGAAVLLVVLLCTRTVGQFGYLRPAMPLRARALADMFRSRPASRKNT